MTQRGYLYSFGSDPDYKPLMHLDVKRLLINNNNDSLYQHCCMFMQLLDNCLRTKLADFGLAKVMPTLQATFE